MKSLFVSIKIKNALINVAKVIKLLIKLVFKNCKLRLFIINWFCIRKYRKNRIMYIKFFTFRVYIFKSLISYKKCLAEPNNRIFTINILRNKYIRSLRVELRISIDSCQNFFHNLLAILTREIHFQCFSITTFIRISNFNIMRLIFL